jgi:hypothetical protein
VDVGAGGAGTTWRAIERFASKGVRAGNRGGALLGKVPLQVHHYATNMSSVYTPRMKAIADRFGLDLDGAWNKGNVAHQGRHPNAYHEFVLAGMEAAAREAGTDSARFIRLFDEYVKRPVTANPQLLGRSGWGP